MKKSILLIMFSMILIFLCVDSAKAVENPQSHICLYKNEDGKRVIIDSNGDGYARAKVLDSFNVYKSGKEKGTIEAGTETKKVYNEFKFQDEWKSEIGCNQYLIYVKSSGDDEVYSTNEVNYKDSEKREVFSLNGSYLYETPDNVTLKELFCTYQLTPKYGYITTYSYNIEYDPNTGSGRYRLYHDSTELWDQDLDEIGINSKLDFFFTDINTQYIDNFNLRAFWDEETNSYSCPNGIYVDRNVDSKGGITGEINEIITISYGLTGSDNIGNLYELAPQASFINYSQNTHYTGNLKKCIYSFEQTTCKKDDKSCLQLSAPVSIERVNGVYYNFINTANFPNYQYGKTEVIYDFSNDYDFDTIDGCAVLPKIYTNCNQKGLISCEITDKSKPGYQVLYENPWANNHDSSDVEEQMGIYEGFKYIPLICDLKKTLLNFIDMSTIDNFPKLSIYTDGNNIKGEYKIQDFPCSQYGFDDTQRCESSHCPEDGSYNISLNALEAKTYCQEIYNIYGNNYENTLYKARVNECISFNKFYNSLVATGIIQDLTKGCDILSTDMQEKLAWILDIIKIAGPILALGLGTLDFIKAIASGDADKEMKTAFKHFSTRLIAAALLFVIPFILAFMMDVFLGNEEGYNSDNPFCNVVDWND